MNGRRWRLLLAGVPALVLLLAAGALARHFLPVRSILGLVDNPACAPSYVYTRLPGREASTAGHWLEAQSYPKNRDEVRAAGAGGAIYVGTGLTAKDGALRSLSELYRFDPARGTYTELPDVPQRVDHTAFITHGDSLFVIGGWVDGPPTSTVWRFSPATRRWTALAPLPTPRGSPAAAVIGDTIYIAGGSRNDQGTTTGALRTVEAYDIASDTWSKEPDMPTPRHHASAAAIDGRLVVVGGRNDDDLSLDVVEQFDPAVGRWTRLAPLPSGAGGLAVVAAAGRVVAIGGGDDAEQWITPATFALDPVSDTWTRLADLNVARHGLGAAVVGADVYVFGGSPCPGYGHTDVVERLDVRASLEAAD